MQPESTLNHSTETKNHSTETNGPAGDRTEVNGSDDRFDKLRWARWVSWLLIVAAAFILVRTLPFDQLSVAFKRWIGGLGMWGPVVLAAIYVVATVLFVPGTILTLAAGAIFGLAIGTATVSVGSTLGASAAFLIARYGAREKVATMAQHNRHFGAIDRAIEEGGWKIVALLRLSPALPFNLQNYLYGLTPVAFWPYAIASWIAMLPGTFLYVYIGHVTGTAIAGDRERSAFEWGMLIVGLLATVAVTVYVTRLANRKLNEQVDEQIDEQIDEHATIAKASDGASTDSKSSQPTHKPIKTVGLAIVGVLMFSISLMANQNRDRIQHAIVSLFGPPAVEMKEQHSEKPGEPTIDHPAWDQIP